MSKARILPIKVDIFDPILQDQLLRFARPLFEKVKNGEITEKSYKDSIVLMVQILNRES
tara:strand:+ start:453 stop:629 length:177 start_codon:yes stop_codon:yes gene_type:complete